MRAMFSSGAPSHTRVEEAGRRRAIGTIVTPVVVYVPSNLEEGWHPLTQTQEAQNHSRTVKIGAHITGNF